jgi:hypothetical protein
MAMPEIYISTDIETNGPLPGAHSMLSFASAALLADGSLLGTFSANLETLAELEADPKTMAWWQTEPVAWEKSRESLQAPKDAMLNYLVWLKSLKGRLVFVGYPVAFDFGFIYWYLMKFAGENPFGFNALDIKTYAMAVLKKEYKQSVKANMPKEWFAENLPHTHVALDDALEQGHLFCKMLALNKS